MKISKNLKENAVYLQKKDVIYLKHILSVSLVDDNKLKDYDLNDFILVEGEENVKLITSRDEILEFKDFLSMTKDQAEQRMDDAEQLLYIVKKKKSPINEILRYRYMYSSAVDEFLEKEREKLSFSVPLALDMLSDYLFYDNDGTYYAASTTLPSTYEIGRIDGDVVNGAVQVGQALNRLVAIEPAHTIVQTVMNEAIMSIRKAQRLIEIV